MAEATIEFVSRLLGAGRYSEIADLVLILRDDALAAGDTATAELLDIARELSLACGGHRVRSENHWEAAGSEAVAERLLRRRLAVTLAHLAGAPDQDGSDGTSRSDAGGLTGALAAPALLTGSSDHLLDAPGPPHLDAALFAVYCFGPLRIYRGEHALGPVPNRRARSVLKYLLVHRARPVPKDVLMDLFWPGATATAARNNLNVAVYGLRRFLHDADGRDGHVSLQGNCYVLNPDMKIWVDLEEFTARVAAARRHGRACDPAAELRELAAAEVLYAGPLFEDDLYEEWTHAPRRTAQDSYVEVLESLRDRFLDLDDAGSYAGVGRKILAVEPAHEPTHRDLMRCYARQGQHHLALRQYHDCHDALRAELDVGPSPETTQLYRRIRAHDPV